MPHCFTASSHAAAAPGTVTVTAWNGGSALPLMPSFRTASRVRPPGDLPLPVINHESSLLTRAMCACT